MASKVAEDAVDSYLAANWTTTPIYTANQQGEIPSDAGAFIIVQYPVSNVQRMSPSQRFYREEGGIRIVINVQRGAGTSLIRQYGSDLANLLRYKDFGGIHTLAPSETFTDDSSDLGLYFQGSLVVEFWRIFTD